MKEKLKSIYKHILTCYKFYASLSLDYEFPCVNAFSFNEFISQTSLMMKRVNMDLSYLAAYILPKDKDYHYVREKSLVRY